MSKGNQNVKSKKSKLIKPVQDKGQLKISTFFTKSANAKADGSSADSTVRQQTSRCETDAGGSSNSCLDVGSASKQTIRIKSIKDEESKTTVSICNVKLHPVESDCGNFELPPVAGRCSPSPSFQQTQERRSALRSDLRTDHGNVNRCNEISADGEQVILIESESENDIVEATPEKAPKKRNRRKHNQLEFMPIKSSKLICSLSKPQIISKISPIGVHKTCIKIKDVMDEPYCPIGLVPVNDQNIQDDINVKNNRKRHKTAIGVQNSFLSSAALQQMYSSKSSLDDSTSADTTLSNKQVVCQDDPVNLVSSSSVQNQIPSRVSCTPNVLDRVNNSTVLVCDFDTSKEVPTRKVKFLHAIENTSPELLLPVVSKTDVPMSSGSVDQFLLPCEKQKSSPKSSLLPLSKSPLKQLPSQSATNAGVEKLLDGFDLEDWDMNAEFEEEMLCKSTLCLETMHRCKVLAVDQVGLPEKRGKILQLQSTVNKLETTCLVSGFWCDYDIEVGSVVSLRAGKSSSDHPRWVLDNYVGLLVLNPDLLISGTAVVGSLFCKRRAVLSSHYQGMEGESRVMIVGILTHNLLQTVLKGNVSHASDVKKIAEELLSTTETIRMLYSSGMSLAEAHTEIFSFVPQIMNFINEYVKDDAGAPKSARSAIKTNWKGKITDILDIEENLWVPKLGLKGKVDITAEVKIHGGKRGIAPIELKTGRASWDAQHKGQVILYKLMMAETGIPVNTGLLLYLRAGEMGPVEEGHAERAGIINLRNELAFYLTRTTVPSVDNPELGSLHLPEPINHHSACGKCPYVTLCSAYLQRDGLEKVSDNNPLKQLIVPSMAHLSPQHVEYFMLYSALLLLENKSQNEPGNSTSDLWTLNPRQREARGTCLRHLTIAKQVENPSGRIECLLHRASPSPGDEGRCNLNPGDYVALSTDTRVAVHTGTISDITPSSVSIVLDRNVTKENEKREFHVDSIGGFRNAVLDMTFLSLLMEDSEKADKLRTSIIDKVPPTFTEALPGKVARQSKEILVNLNGDQQLAVLKALYANDYLLIKGMPGTGKTSTIVLLIAVLVKLGKSVLVAAHTHSAVDNVLLKVKEQGVSVLRLGATSRVHPSLKDQGEAVLYQQCRSPEELEERFMSMPVVGCTCLGMGHTLLVRRRFDTCIVDESTQALQTTVLRALYIADKFVLVGDPAQLAPLVRSKKARKLGLAESLFARLDGPDATVVLREQYRMNQVLTDLANGLTYGGLLQCGSPEVASATINLNPRPESPQMSPSQFTVSWLQHVLSSKLEHSVVFLDTGATWSHREKSSGETNLGNEEAVTSNEEVACKNIAEAAVILHLLNYLKKREFPGIGVGVIAPYRAQVALLRKLVGFYPDVEVNTVDQFQGRDKDVILYSCTRSNAPDSWQESELLSDKRRLTVAITRAKHKLVLVGDVASLSNYAPFKQLLDCLNEQQILPLRNGYDGFQLDPLIADMKVLQRL